LPAQLEKAQPSNRIEVTGSRLRRADARAADPQVQQWLDLITELLDRHLDDDARDSWVQFRRAYPDAWVPATLQARIDALNAGAPAPPPAR